MTHAGACGKTAEEMRAVLRYGIEDGKVGMMHL
jgi:hypothetical protein